MQELIGPGGHRQRLARACSPGLQTLKSKEVPQESRADFGALLQLIGAAGSSTPADVASRIASLSEGQLLLAAETMLSIYDQLARYQPLRVPGTRGRGKRTAAGAGARTAAAPARRPTDLCQEE
ncbi:hypothetical protein [Duganella caerulea]|uniref:hypothetical protein n=1 Tax=Duganella caerulea TaxID=2885762 RepID=UPI0040384E48